MKIYQIFAALLVLLTTASSYAQEHDHSSPSKDTNTKTIESVSSVHDMGSMQHAYEYAWVLWLI